MHDYCAVWLNSKELKDKCKWELFLFRFVFALKNGNTLLSYWLYWYYINVVFIQQCGKNMTF